MPLACNARRRASMTPKLGGGAAPQPPSYESMMEAAEPTGAPAPAPATTRVSSKTQRFGVTPYGAGAPLDGGPTPAERKAALLKKRQSLAVMSRFSHTGGRGVTYSGSGTGNDEENRPPMAGGAAEGGARGPLKPRAASVNVVPAAVNTNIVKPTTGIYAAAEQQAAQAQGQPQLDPKQASALLKYLRATVNRAEQVGKRLQVLAQAQRGPGGIRPSQEVLSLSSRLQAANAAALDALATLFPPELFPLLAAEEASAEQEPQQEQQEALEEGQQRGEEKASLLSVVAEEEEEEGAEAAPEAEAGAGQLEAMVEAVEQQLSELDAEEAGAVAVPAAPEAGAEDTETVAVEDEIEEDEAQPEQGPEEGEPMAPAGAAGAPDSPPSMSDLGLSHFTRRFILEAKKGSPTIAQGKAAGAACEKAAAGAAGISPTLSASPTSPPLPIEKRAAEAAAAASVMGTPVITMPTADGERAFPSPVFRTGVKLRHPPASGDARAPSSGPHSAKSSSSTNSSSLPSPQLFEPKSVDRTGARHSLRAPAALDAAAEQQHPFLAVAAGTRPPPGSVLRGADAAKQQQRQQEQCDASFASFASSAPTPGLASPALRRTRLQQQLVAAAAPAPGASTDVSGDPTPALPSTAAAGGNETPSTARCIRLLQFPPSGARANGGGAGPAAVVPGSGSATRAHKSMGRTPLGGNGALDESMTHNYPDLTVHSTSFCFSPKGLGLDAEADPLPHPTKPATTTSSTPPAAAAAAASTPPGSSSRYFLRSAEKKARELSAAKAREQAEAAKPRAAGVTASGGGNSSLRKSPRLAAAASSSATRSQALAAANARRGSFTGAGAQQGRGQQRLFGGEEEEEEGVGQLVEVGEAEYSKTPSFIRIQVTRDMLNAAIAAINAHVAAAGPQLEPMERVMGVVAQGDASKTVLLSLVHLKRVEIVVDARGQKAYKLWH